MSDTSNPVRIFISYAHEDKDYCTRLAKHFRPMERQGKVKVWTDGEIEQGDLWDDEIKKALTGAEIVLFLISSDFVFSDYIDSVEMNSARERYAKGEVIIIPVIIRHCDFSSLELSRFQAAPSGGKPISSWNDHDEAYVDVINGMKRVIERLRP